MNDEITLKLTPKALDVIATALGQRPYIEVAETLQSIGQQIAAQRQPPGPLSPADAMRGMTYDAAAPATPAP